MSLGKDSIKKRVAKTAEPEAVEAAPATEAAAPKKTTTRKSTKKAPVTTAVVTNVSPETVAAVTGHEEDAKYEKVSLGNDLPYFLL